MGWSKPADRSTDERTGSTFTVETGNPGTAPGSRIQIGLCRREARGQSERCERDQAHQNSLHSAPPSYRPKKLLSSKRACRACEVRVKCAWAVRLISSVGQLQWCCGVGSYAVPLQRVVLVQRGDERRLFHQGLDTVMVAGAEAARLPAASQADTCRGERRRAAGSRGRVFAFKG
jgi:hypothetical protein